MQETRARSLDQEDPRRRKWQPTPVFLPGKSHGQRSLVGYSPWGHKELDMTEQLTHTQILMAGQYIPHLQGFAKLLEPSLYIN